MFESIDLLTIVFNAIGIGFGSAIGNYFANRLLIKNLEKLSEVKK